MSAKFEDEFLRGMRDCHNGELAKIDQSEAYNEGFSAQYQHEQQMTEMTKHGS